MPGILIAHPGTGPFVQASVRGYAEAGLLDTFITSFMHHPDSRFSRFLDASLPFLRREFARRAIEGVSLDRIQSLPASELIRVAAARLINPVFADLVWEWTEHRFDRKVAGCLRKNTRAVHVYEHAALATLGQAKKLGIPSIYEQPSQHHTFFTRIATEQFRRFPELHTAQSDLLTNHKSRVRNLRRDRELELADYIRCNSSFTRKTLIDAGIPADKISVIPLGFPEVTPFTSKSVSDKIIFLNAGSQNLRKGIHLLCNAWRTCQFKPGEAELWLIGKMILPESIRMGLPGKVVIRDNIPREELLNLYRQADVFVLPTLADGFGMVISEAMSRALPVITTDCSGGPDIITHQANGFILPAGSESALVAQLKWCVENKHRLPEMGYQAWLKAQSWQWNDFGKAVAGFIREKIPENRNAGAVYG